MDFTNEVKAFESSLKPVEPIPFGQKGSRITISEDGVMYITSSVGLQQTLKVKAGDVVECDGSKWFVLK